MWTQPRAHRNYGWDYVRVPLMPPPVGDGPAAENPADNGLRIDTDRCLRLGPSMSAIGR